MRLFCKLSSSESSDPYHFGGTRSVLSWETIVHYPRYKLRGQIRLKDTTLSLCSDMLLIICLHCSSIGSCTALEYLSTKGNFFQGSIPSSFSPLRGIRNLDLPRNNLSSKIPEFLQEFDFQLLNLSCNDF